MKIKLFTVAIAALLVMSTSCSKSEKQAEAEAPAEEEVIAEPEPEPFVGCLANGVYKGTGDFNGKYPITLMVAVDGERAAGYYYYNKYKSPILLSGIVGPLFLTLQEYTDGENTGDFYGTVESDLAYTGQFTNHSTDKKLSYDVKFELVDTSIEGSRRLFDEVKDLDPKGTYTYSAPANDTNTSDYTPSSASTTSSTGSASIDEWLNSYERYVNNCISYINKAAAGDMSAMAEYAAMLGDIAELQDKLDHLQGQMSGAQISRFTKIVTRFSQATAKLQGM